MKEVVCSQAIPKRPKLAPGKFSLYFETDQNRFFAAKVDVRFSHPDVRLYFLKADNEEEVCRAVCYEFLFIPFTYSEESPFFAKLALFKMGTELLAADTRDLGKRVTKNILANAKASFYRLDELVGSFKNRLAVVCGAGPSLKKYRKELALLQSKAFMLSSGSAIEKLRNLGLEPHAMAHVDPEPAIENYLAKKPFLGPLFFEPRLSSTLLAKAPGKKICSLGSTALEKWLFPQMVQIEEGWTSSVFALHIAYHLGCNPILLFGVDLEGEKADFIMEAHAIADFIRKHPDVTVLKNSIPENLEAASFELTPCEVIEVDSSKLELIFSSLKISESICSQLLVELEKSFPKSPSENGKIALLDVELTSEIAYELIIAPVWHFWQFPLKIESRSVQGGEFGDYLNSILFFKQVIECYS